jgi:hypothetical protein
VVQSVRRVERANPLSSPHGEVGASRIGGEGLEKGGEGLILLTKENMEKPN